MFASVYFGIHYWFWLNLIAEPMLPAPWFGIATTALILLACSIPFSGIARFAFKGNLRRFFMYLSYTWLGVMAFIAFHLILVELGQVLYAWMARPTAMEQLQVNRLLAGASAVSVALFTAIGLYQGLGPTPIKKISIPISNLPDPLSGLRIVQLTDIHIGPTAGPAFIKELVEKTNALEPDIVAITGDLVDGRVSELGEQVSGLKNLKAKHGVYFVTGNHEYYSGVDEWIRFLPGLGIEVLMNDRVSIDYNGSTIDLAGVPDLTGHRIGPPHKPDLEQTLEGRNPNHPLILLAHQPRQWTSAAKQGVSLQLSGHTHGGQFFPFNLAVKAVEPYFRGLYRKGESALYISRGNGYWGPPLRFGVPRELTLIELASL